MDEAGRVQYQILCKLVEMKGVGEMEAEKVLLQSTMGMNCRSYKIVVFNPLLKITTAS